MESLTSLDLSNNRIERGWQHLSPLTRLQKLRASVNKRNMPEALQALKNMTILPPYSALDSFAVQSSGVTD